jgi:hypothetical protein
MATVHQSRLTKEWAGRRLTLESGLFIRESTQRAPMGAGTTTPVTISLSSATRLLAQDTAGLAPDQRILRDSVTTATTTR